MFNKIVLFLLISINAFSQDNPVQLALFNPIQVVNENQDISAVRINLIYSVNGKVSGVDWGFINVTKKKSSGLQIAALGIHESDYTGLMSNAIAWSKASVEGVQFSFVNRAEHVNGIQIGVVNYAGSLKGIQIGLINIIKTGGAFPVFPIVNWSF